MIQKIFKASWLETPLGPMLAIGDEETLYLLEFKERLRLEEEMERMRKKTQSTIVPGTTEAINSIAHELKLYFNGKLKKFKTPLFFLGTPFQKRVWEELQKIPFGETRSYADIAIGIEKPTAFRAVAQANGANQIALVIPCHRVINSNGAIGGYAGGLHKKKWLLNHEKRWDR